jgi:hypothetical protein
MSLRRDVNFRFAPTVFIRFSLNFAPGFSLGMGDPLAGAFRNSISIGGCWRELDVELEGERGRGDEERSRQGEVVRALIKTFGLGETLERKDQMRDAVEAVWGELERGRREESSKRACIREGGREGGRGRASEREGGNSSSICP